MCIRDRPWAVATQEIKYISDYVFKIKKSSLCTGIKYGFQVSFKISMTVLKLPTTGAILYVCLKVESLQTPSPTMEVSSMAVTSG